MKAREITANNRLDSVLVQLCDMIINCDGRPHSMVGAAVVDPKGRTVLKLGTPVSQDPELWCHAERTAIDAYNKQYGELPAGCVIVTTLSPCSSERMKLRYDESCTDLLEQLGIQRVYCGYMDPSQDNSDHKFKLRITGNTKLQELCKRIGDAVLNRDGEHLHKLGVTEGQSVPEEIEEFLESLSPDDVGVEEFPGYRVHYEGFTDDCKQSADYQRNPDAVYQQVYRDFVDREHGQKPIESNMVGDEEYPILYSIFRAKR